MGDKLLTGALLLDKAGKIRHFVQYGFGGLKGLLDGRYQNFLYTLRFDDFPFRKTAIQEGKFGKAYLGGFLGKPLYPIHILGGCHGYV